MNRRRDQDEKTRSGVYERDALADLGHLAHRYQERHGPTLLLEPAQEAITNRRAPAGRTHPVLRHTIHGGPGVLQQVVTGVSAVDGRGLFRRFTSPKAT